MLNFLFWNLQKKSRDEQVATLARECAADIICLAEGEGIGDKLLALLNVGSSKMFRENEAIEPGKVRVFSRFSNFQLIPIDNDQLSRMTIWRLVLEETDLFIATIHFQSKLNYGEIDQAAEMTVISRRIRDVESSYGHSRTVVLGDFNMNPFEHGMVIAHGMHAVATRDIAKRESRTVAGTDHPFFYNPMWVFFGDRTVGPPGTHFAWLSKPLCHFWNIYDQVLVRSSLLNHLSGDVRILESIGGRSLLSDNGRPDPRIGTDHLPLFFSLSIES